MGYYFEYDDDNDAQIPDVLQNTIRTLLFTSLAVLAIAIIVIVSVASEVKEKHPQDYNDFIAEFLGDQGDITVYIDDKEWVVETPNDSFIRVESPLPAFYTTYWNGRQVLFSVPDDIWSAAITAYNKYSWCDPRFIVALAHSEGPAFKNNVCSWAGACGTWQFMPGTWAGLWKGTNPIPDRSDNIAAADAACRYTKDNGIQDALYSDNEVKFIWEFAVDPPVWNMHTGQAKYVFALYSQLKTGSADEFSFLPELSHTGPKYSLTKVWWKQPFIWLLKSFKLLPEKLKFKPENNQLVIEPGEGDDLLAFPSTEGVVSWGLHGQNYGNCAIDITAGNGSTVISSINGEVTQKYEDGYGNPIIRIENSIYMIEFYHGDWQVQVGDKVKIGQVVGTESNQGNTGYVDDQGAFHYCGTGSGCGYHTHWNVIRKGKPCVDPQTLVNWPP